MLQFKKRADYEYVRLSNFAFVCTVTYAGYQNPINVFCRSYKSLPVYKLQSLTPFKANKLGFMVTQVACGWAGAKIEMTFYVVEHLGCFREVMA